VRLLILGGTRFVGRHIAEAALAAGWDLTLFNRGRQEPGLFPEAEHRVGDRDGGLGALREGEWDAVVDTCGYVPRVVRMSAELLADRVGLYVFISSGSAYADKSRPGLTEDAPLARLEDRASEDVEADYDGLKALCERTVQEAMGERAVVVRPGLIVGPHDPTNRFTYWVTRIAKGGDVLAPQPTEQPVQVIDARDLAAFVMHLVSARRAGSFNAVGDVASMRSTLETIAQVTGSEARLQWVDEQRLLDAGLEPWRDVPLWLAPQSDPLYRDFLAMSNARAKAAGLVLRPLAATVVDTLAWAFENPAPTDPPAGLDPDVERRLLADGDVS
jgi:2'-hydroxyisoflavone reductase